MICPIDSQTNNDKSSHYINVSIWLTTYFPNTVCLTGAEHKKCEFKKSTTVWKNLNKLKRVKSQRKRRIMVLLSLNFLLQVKINVPSALTDNISWTTAFKIETLHCYSPGIK